MQSNRRLHVGLIMDGNGRWAEQRGFPRPAGHRAGARVVRRIVRAAPDLGIGILTLYAFSSDNWQRPPGEIETLFDLFRRYLWVEADRCLGQGVELTVIGRRDRLPRQVVEAIERAETLTRGGLRLRLRIAIDYSGRDAIRRAALELAARSGPVASLADFACLVAAVDHGTPVGPADLIVRTGGERRLSDFLVWESAYAELFFLDTPWPDFTPRELAAVVSAFGRRERRFGGLVPQRGPGRLLRNFVRRSS